MIFTILLGIAAAVLASSEDSTACNNSPELCARRYNEISHLGAHNSPFLRDQSNNYSVSGNQYYNSTIQLAAGVRLLTAQAHYGPNSTDLHVCHTLCQLLDAGTLSGWLREVKTWMDGNPNDVVTILIVNSAGANASELGAAYEEAGLASYAYSPTSTTATAEWPSLQDLIDSGARAMNFVASLRDNDAAPYLMDEFTYIFENAYDVVDVDDFACEPDRPKSLTLSSAVSQNYLSLMNHFKYIEVARGIQIPDEDAVNVTNAPSGGAGNLGEAARKCSSAYGSAPNFLLVDFFNIGPAVQVVDELNGISPTGRLDISTDVRPPPISSSGTGHQDTTDNGTQSAVDTGGENATSTGSEGATSAEIASTGTASGTASSASSPRSLLGLVLVAVLQRLL